MQKQNQKRRNGSEVYNSLTNHSPQFLFTEDIRAFRTRRDLPDELFTLDILDGSPPCSSFLFREGQVRQRLDDLFFEFIALAKSLRPKIVIAENVKGLLQGNAKAYVKRIIDGFIDAGYSVQLFSFECGIDGCSPKT